MSKVWGVSGNNYYMSNQMNYVQLLEPAIYTVCSSMISGIYLQRLQDNFTFNYKIYDKDDDFIKTTLTAWDNLKDNLGVILNGVKGTGKTVTAKQIANETGLPIILVDSNFDGLVNFLSKIEQDVVIFIDEYEKIFKENNTDLLSLMDGAYNNGYRKFFIFTTNDLTVNINLIERPSRIRYIKKYDNLAPNITKIIVDDLLLRKEYTVPLLEFISKLSTITIDIVKTLIEEVNIQDRSPQEFYRTFNIRVSEPYYKLYRITEDVKGEPIKMIVNSYIRSNNIPRTLNPNGVRDGNYIIVVSDHLGTLTSISKDGHFTTQMSVTKNVQEGKKVKTITELEDRVYKLEKCNNLNDVYDEYNNENIFSY